MKSISAFKTIQQIQQWWQFILRVNIDEWWRGKSPREKWLAIHDFGGFLSTIDGVRIFGDVKQFSYNHTPTVLVTYYMTVVGYTLWYYFTEGSFMKGLQCTCGVGIFLMCGTLFAQAITGEYHAFNSVIEFGGKYIYCDTESSIYYAMYEKMVAELLKQLAIILSILLSSFGVLGLSVFYQIIFEKNRVTFLSTELPFFEKDSDIGYVVNLSTQFIVCLLGGIGLIVIEIGACLANNAMAVIPEIIYLDGKELEKEVDENGMSRIAELRLRSIIMKSADCYGYIMLCCDCYYMRFTQAPIVCTYSICFSILSQLIYDYPSGYALAAITYTLLILCCYHGHNESQTYERIIKELYNMKWYLFSTSSQKQIYTTVHMLQNGVVATFGPFGPLNLKSATDFTKSIYKFTMLLNRFFK